MFIIWFAFWTSGAFIGFSLLGAVLELDSKWVWPFALFSVLFGLAMAQHG